MACVETISGKPMHVAYDLVPRVVYTFPEVASVGRTEEELRRGGVDYRVGKFMLERNARANCNGEEIDYVLEAAKLQRVLGSKVIHLRCIAFAGVRETKHFFNRGIGRRAAGEAARPEVMRSWALRGRPWRSPRLCSE